mmetsp:Transcript_53404/g.116585  ORF Transcript_53404/g.116585 Transcript_53404/m.116585 type:complete len:305 (+) Transcript_53404:205-1119(+)
MTDFPSSLFLLAARFFGAGAAGVAASSSCSSSTLGERLPPREALPFFVPRAELRAEAADELIPPVDAASTDLPSSFLPAFARAGVGVLESASPAGATSWSPSSASASGRGLFLRRPSARAPSAPAADDDIPLAPPSTDFASAALALPLRARGAASAPARAPAAPDVIAVEPPSTDLASPAPPLAVFFLACTPMSKEAVEDDIAEDGPRTDFPSWAPAPRLLPLGVTAGAAGAPGSSSAGSSSATCCAAPLPVSEPASSKASVKTSAPLRSSPAWAEAPCSGEAAPEAPNAEENQEDTDSMKPPS